MRRPQVYFVDGIAVALKGNHIFKGVMSGFSSDISKLQEVADVFQLRADSEGIYYLQNEGCEDDSADKYLIASKGVACAGCSGEDGTISSVLSPKYIYDNYREAIGCIRELLNINLDDSMVSLTLLRLLFIGVCGELEGYLYSTIISLVQGSRDALNAIKECRGLPQPCLCTQKYISDIVGIINDKFHFQHIRNKNAKEREIYERLIGEPLIISQDLRDNIEWRNKLAHKVPIYYKPIYPSKEDILNFIDETDKVVNFIDSKIDGYKKEWLKELA